MRRLVYLWALPNTIIGLSLAAASRLTGGRIALRGGVIEASGGVLGDVARIGPGPGIGAMTLGHVVLATNEAQMASSRAHERAHVHQYERWGPLFIPAYVVSSLAAAIRGQNGYAGNRFEREANRIAEGNA